MKKTFYIPGIALIVILGATNFASALITCPAGSHTFSGGTQASGYDMCIPDVGSSGPVSGSSGQSSATFTPSTKSTITPSGTTAQTQTQGIAMDTQVDSEVSRLYGTSIYNQAKTLYDNSISVNQNDYNAVASQTQNADYNTSDALRRAYNVRAIERLNQVWNGIMALETSYAEQLKQQTATPTPITPTPITPAPITPAPITPASYSASDLKPGKTFTAPANQPANIVTPGQSIILKAGSVIKYIDQYTWQTVKGTIRFLEKVAINGRYKVRLNGGAAVSVRGTQFIINEAANTTTLTLLKGSVTATSAKGNASITLKEGYRLAITKGVLGKPVKINTAQLDASWYENIPAGANFTNASWQKSSAAANWSSDCAITTGQSTATETLTADEQTLVDYLNQKASPVFRIHEIDTFASPTKISSVMEKTTLNNGAKTISALVNGKSLYYSSDKAGKVWKVFQDKNITDNMLKNAKSHNIVYGINKNTLAFDHWDKAGNSRVAVYKAVATQDGTDSLIRNAFDPSATSSPTLLNVKIYINEDTQQWIKTEASINYPTGKILLPIYQTCKYAYDTAKTKVPAKAKSVTSKAGIAEMQKIYNAMK
ncbi:MAG: hypothetical protein PHF50_02660 [Patescibacteria group bacterium]|nr:hypothetical protein [Patescibacteria group bacterium]